MLKNALTRVLRGDLLKFTKHPLTSKLWGNYYELDANRINWSIAKNVENVKNS